MTKQDKPTKAPKKDEPERRKSRGRRSPDSLLPNFKDLVDKAPQAIFVHANFRPLYANKACAKLFGFASVKEVRELPLIRNFFPKENWPQIEAHHDELLRGETLASERRMRCCKKDGSDIWISLAERVIDWHGTPAVQISAFDITKQVQTEESVLDREQRLSAMLEILPVPVYIARLEDGKLLFVNRKTCLLFQESAGNLLKKSSVDFFVDEKDRESLKTLLKEVNDVREVELRMKTAQDRAFTAELAAIAMDYADENALLVSLNDISERKQLEAELFHQASTDSLTGISNRRYFIMQAEKDVRRAQRFGHDLSVMMIDLDHFKRVNDTLGHAVGDVVLESVVKACKNCLRELDVMGRLGGEEFGVILPETGWTGAMEVAERIRQYVSEKAVITPEGVVNATISIGVAVLEKEDENIDSVLKRADQALYYAKESGRDRVARADEIKKIKIT